MSRTVGRGAALVVLLCSMLVLTPPAAGAAIKPPASLSAFALSSSSIRLSWTDNSTDETGYEIRRSLRSTTSTFVTIATTAANATSYVDAGLASSTKYFYRARARRNGATTGWSKVVNATTPATSSVAPGITTQPVNQAVTAPASATFSVTATGTPAPTYQWQKNGSPIGGATSASYTTPATTTADSGSTFRVVVTNSVSAVTSSSATLTVSAAPVAPAITTQPVSQAVTAPASATFSVTATGTAPLSYQWQKNGAPIAGATNASYATPATSTADSGSTFRVVVTNSVTAVTSNSATLTVNAPPDTTTPSISVLHSPSNPLTTTTVTLTATASDANGISAIAVTLDGSVVHSCPSSPCAYTLPTPIATGTHTYSATATDNSPNHNIARDPASGNKSFTVTQSATFNPKLVGSLAGVGSPTDVAASGSSAFIASSTFGFSIADVTNPGATRVLGASTTSFSGTRVAVRGSRAVVSGTSSGKLHVWVIDTSVPNAPQVLGEVSSTLTASALYEVALNDAGTRAVIALAAGGVMVVDLTNPAAPTTATFDTAGTAYAAALNAAGTLAYVADGAGGLKVLSLANPAAPTQVGNLVVSGIMREITVAGNVAYLADQMGRIVTVDVTTPSAPLQLGALVMGRYTFHVAVEGNRAVVITSDSADWLEVIDVSSPANPVRVGTPLLILASGQSKAVALAGGRAYVAASTSGLKIYDLSVASIGGLTDDFVGARSAAAGTRVVIAGTYVPTNTARLRVIDASVPSAPRVVGELPSIMVPTAFFAVALNDAGTRAVIALASGGVMVVDLTNPAAPTTATFDTAGTAYAVALNGAGTIVYVADGAGGLKVLSLANPAAPTQVGNLVLSGIMRDIVVVGNVVSLADQMGRLVTVDVTTPSAPSQLGALVMGRYTFHLAADASRVVVHTADSADYLNVVDVSNPANPVFVGTPLAISGAGEVKELALAGGRAYVASHTAGLKIYDVNGSTPVLLGAGYSVGAAGDVSLVGSTAYVADAAATISVIDLFAP